jgi:phage tail protein X
MRNTIEHDTDEEEDFLDDETELDEAPGFARRHEKLMLSLGVLLIGMIGALAFRKAPPPLTTTEPQQEFLASPPAAPPSLIPVAQPLASHLLGRIEPLAPADPQTSMTDASEPWVGGSPLDQLAPPPDPHAIQPVSHQSMVPVPNPFAQQAQLDPDQLEYRLHQVSDGDTLAGLAARYLGSSKRYQEIFDLNRALLRDPNVLPIGVEIKIPRRDVPQVAHQVPTQPRPMQTVPEAAPLVPIEY